MALTTEITERDKKLIVLLVAFLIVAFFVWCLIRPTINAIMDAREQLAFERITQTENENKIANIESYEADVESLTAEAATAVTGYYPLLANDGVDNLLTNLALANGFSKQDLLALEIKAPEGDLQLSDYQDAENVYQLSGLYGATATFRLSGSRDQLQSFLDVLENDKSLMITAFTWGATSGASGTSTATAGASANGSYALTVELVVFMYDDGGSEGIAQ